MRHKQLAKIAAVLTTLCALALIAAVSMWPQPPRVLCFGDSITAGIQNNFTQTPGYRPELKRLLDEDGHSVTFVGSLVDAAGFHHEGHSGWTSAELLTITPEVMQQSRPDIVLVDSGTNDLVAGDSPEVCAHHFAMLVSTIYDYNPRAFVVVARLSHMSPKVEPSTARRDKYNLLVGGIAADLALTHRCEVVDFSKMPMSDLSDTVHPNSAGYAYMAERWNRAIRRYYGN